jgi:hypothetical protein
MFDIDPDKPNIPALARILSGMGLLLLVGSISGLMLAFSGYAWVNEIYAMAGSVAAFLVALLFLGQAKILELMAVIAARTKSRFAIEGAVEKLKSGAGTVLAASSASWAGPTARPPQDRVIHVPDEQARQSGFKVK